MNLPSVSLFDRGRVSLLFCGRQPPLRRCDFEIFTKDLGFQAPGARAMGMATDKYEKDLERWDELL
jgi:hypothetical protein